MKKTNITKLTGIAMLSAVAFVLQFLEISVPIMPSFIKLDFSDLPELIGAFAYGPWAGVIIALIKNVLHMPLSSTMYIGEMANFLMGAVFAFTAGMIYKRKKDKKGAIIAAVSGAAAMAVFSIIINYFVVYPLYYSVLGMPEAAVLDMYKVIMPEIKNIFQAILVFNVPFTFIKGVLCALICLPIYKPLSPLLKRNMN